MASQNGRMCLQLSSPMPLVCSGRPLVQTSIALGLIRPEIKAWMQSPLRQGTSPFSCTPGRGGFGRPRRREQRLAPHHSQYACLPFSSHTPPLPPNRARARNHSRGSEFRPLLFDACFLQTSLLDAVEQARQWLKEQRLSDA